MATRKMATKKTIHDRAYEARREFEANLKPHQRHNSEGAKPSPAGAGQTEGSRIWETLRKIEARVDMLNERENLGSFALAGAPRAAAGPSLQTAPIQPPSILQRVASCEVLENGLDERISQLYSRVCDIERALFGEAKG